MILMAEVTLNLTCNQLQVVSWFVGLIFVTSSIPPYGGIDTPFFIVPLPPYHIACKGYTHPLLPNHHDAHHHHYAHQVANLWTLG